MTNAIGFHFVDNIYTDGEIPQHMALLRATKPAWINVLGGAQYREALAFARLVRRDLPDTKVIFRHYKDGGDDGMHTRLTADQWWTQIGALYIGSDLTILTDNESGEENLTYYSDWHARIMELAALDGVSIAYGRFSTHNPPARQWPQLASMFAAGNRYRNLHVWSPNVYYSDDNLDGISHVLEAWQYYPRVPTVIGEYAYAYRLDPHKGYRALKINGAVYAHELMEVGQPLWDSGIAACVYSIGAWPIGRDTFSLDSDALKVIKDNPMILTVDPFPSGAYDRTGTIHITSGAPFVNLRAQPDSKSEDLGDILEGDVVRTWSTGIVRGWLPVEVVLTSKRGWVSGSVAGLQQIVEPPAPDNKADLIAIRDLLQQAITNGTAAVHKLDELIDKKDTP